MIFVSTMTYALGKELGFSEATAEFQRQLAEPDTDSLPCVRVIARLRSYDEVGVHHDAAATSIGKARSRAFFEGLKLNPDVYICVDDDVEADAFTLGLLIEAVQGRDDVVCLAPCITRGSNVVNVALEPDAPVRELESGGRTRRIVAGGFGLAAMSGATMARLVRAYPDLHFHDEGVNKPALFLEQLEPLDGAPRIGHSLVANSWLGEDVSFCRRVLFSGVRLEALATGLTSHQGQILKLDRVSALSVAPSPAPFHLEP